MAKGGKRKVAPGDVASNRQASHRFEFLDRLECGLVLQGTEVKSLRNGSAQIKDGYAAIHDGELWLHNVHIPPYGPAARENHDPERARKLLVHRRELDRLAASSAERGLTLVPLRLYFKGPRAKVEIAVARGKDRFDKRQSIKKRETERRHADARCARPIAEAPEGRAGPKSRTRCATPRAWTPFLHDTFVTPFSGEPTRCGCMCTSGRRP